MPQIYGYAYHSPLFLLNLTPRKEYYPIYLEAKWFERDVIKNIKPLLNEVNGRVIILIAGSLTVLKAAIKGFPKLACKVILCDYPGLINPFKDPLLEWIDADHQIGGAWQTSKIKYEAHAELLVKLDPLDNQGRELIQRMVRWQSRDRVCEIEQLAESMPASYKQLVDYETTELNEDKTYDVTKDHSWKKKSFQEVVKEALDQASKQDRKPIFDYVLSYLLGKLPKREFTSKLKSFTETNPVLKKKMTLLRKWVDDSKHGKQLFQTYLDYLANLEKRSWKTILDDSTINEIDLLIVIAQQPRNDEISVQYSEEIKDVKQLPPNMFAPEPIYTWQGLDHYHPEPPVLALLFDF